MHTTTFAIGDFFTFISFILTAILTAAPLLILFLVFKAFNTRREARLKSERETTTLLQRDLIELNERLAKIEQTLRSVQ